MIEELDVKRIQVAEAEAALLRAKAKTRRLKALYDREETVRMAEYMRSTERRTNETERRAAVTEELAGKWGGLQQAEQEQLEAEINLIWARTALQILLDKMMLTEAK